MRKQFCKKSLVSVFKFIMMVHTYIHKFTPFCHGCDCLVTTERHLLYRYILLCTPVASTTHLTFLKNLTINVCPSRAYPTSERCHSHLPCRLSLILSTWPTHLSILFSIFGIFFTIHFISRIYSPFYMSINLTIFCKHTAQINKLIHLLHTHITISLHHTTPHFHLCQIQ